MLYGNSSMGYSYSPDRRNDKVDHYPLRSTFLGASGSRQFGYYGMSNGTEKRGGHYLGNGQYVED